MKNDRNTDGTCSSGNTGRTKGSRNKKTLAVESLLEGQAEAFTQTAVARALQGDSVALRLCMERIAPPPKSQTVFFNILKIKIAINASETSGSGISLL